MDENVVRLLNDLVDRIKPPIPADASCEGCRWFSTTQGKAWRGMCAATVDHGSESDPPFSSVGAPICKFVICCPKWEAKP